MVCLCVLVTTMSHAKTAEPIKLSFGADSHRPKEPGANILCLQVWMCLAITNPCLKIQKSLPSVLWCCWLGGTKGIWPVKNWIVGFWHGSMSGQICIWPSWCHCHSLSLAPVNPDWFYLPGFTFLVPAHPDGHGQNPKEPQNCACACMHACVRASVFHHCRDVTASVNNVKSMLILTILLLLHLYAVNTANHVILKP